MEPSKSKVPSATVMDLFALGQIARIAQPIPLRGSSNKNRDFAESAKGKPKIAPEPLSKSQEHDPEKQSAQKRLRWLSRLSAIQPVPSVENDERRAKANGPLDPIVSLFARTETDVAETVPSQSQLSALAGETKDTTIMNGVAVYSQPKPCNANGLL